MKSTAAFIVCLTALAVISWQSGESADASPGSVNSLPVEGGMVSIREFALKPGVDPADFEAYVAREYVPSFSRYWPGARILVVKGERGKDVGKYIHLIVFDSKSIRDLYFPTPDGPSPVFTSIIEEHGGMDGYMNIMETFAEYVEFSEDETGQEYTDYAAIE